jgi:glycosyltransferase involved in cell wall biosynthesis
MTNSLIRMSPSSHDSPKISIGLPVYNGELSIGKVLQSLVWQSFTDFELIISDNASTDKTGSICKEFSNQDSRIKYIKQEKNIGASENFSFVLKKALGKYFLWAAHDDIRSDNFLEVNVKFLEEHPDFVASTSPNCFEGSDSSFATVDFSIEAETGFKRFQQFLEYCWESHGIFYSLIRTDILKQCEIIGETFIAADWAIDLFLVKQGKVHRSQEGMTIFGIHGISRQANTLQLLRTYSIERFLPFYKFSCYALKISSDFSVRERLYLFIQLIRLNSSFFMVKIIRGSISGIVKALSHCYRSIR